MSFHDLELGIVDRRARTFTPASQTEEQTVAAPNAETNSAKAPKANAKHSKRTTNNKQQKENRQTKGKPTEQTQKPVHMNKRKQKQGAFESHKAA